MKKIRNFIKYFFNLYDLKDLQSGGHCGCCGKWVKDEVLPKDWPITICKNCLGN